MSQKTSERKCLFCENIIHGSHLSKHLQEVHKDSQIGASVYPFKCDLCTYSTKRKHDLKRHIQQKHSRCEVEDLPCWTGGNKLKDSLKFWNSHEDQDRQLLIKSLIVLKKLDLSINVSTLKELANQPCSNVLSVQIL